MDAKTLNKTTVRRGFEYGYHFIAANDTNKPTLLLLHGFPSTSADWTAQFVHFAAQGYGLVVPDLLGYGDTDAPKEFEHYDLHAIAEDVIDVLDAQDVKKVVGIGHDWGSFLLGRLANKFPERFIGFAFLAVGYIPPLPDFKWDAGGVNIDLAYWELPLAEDSAELVEKNIDSFYDLIFPDDPAIWKTELTPKNAARNWVETGKRGPLATNFDAEAHKKALLKKGLWGAQCWYKARAFGVNRDSEIPQERYFLTTPTLFVGASRDYICIEEGQLQITKIFASNLAVESLDTSHWVMFDQPKELNAVLERFITGLKG